MTTNQILTLQFGTYANYTCAHWWNIQEHSFSYTAESKGDINHDVLYREGSTQKGQITFTPRTLIVDFKDSIPTLKEHGELYDDVNMENISKENHGFETEIKGNTLEKSKFQQTLLNADADLNECLRLDGEVKHWSDFLYSRFHPRTINVIKDCSLNSERTAFPSGADIWKSNFFGDDLSDKIRRYIEECDHFTGFHCLVDVYNVFGGVASACLEYIADEYPSRSVLAVPVIAPMELNDSYINSIRIANIILSLGNFIDFSNLIVPFSTSSSKWVGSGAPTLFPHLNYNNNLPYHSSAILASTLDTLTLKYRLKNCHYTLRDVCTDITMGYSKVCAASVCLPFNIPYDQDLLTCLDNWQGSLTTCISPSCKLNFDQVAQLYVLRGLSENRLKSQLNESHRIQQSFPAYKCTSIKEMLEFYMSCNSHAAMTHTTVTESTLNTKIPYPRIFGDLISNNGNIMPHKSSGIVDSVPVLAGLHNGSFIGNMLHSLYEDGNKIRIKTLHQFTENEYGDQFDSNLNKLLDTIDCYNMTDRI